MLLLLVSGFTTLSELLPEFPAAVLFYFCGILEHLGTYLPAEPLEKGHQVTETENSKSDVI